MRFKQFISEEERKIYGKKYTPEEAEKLPAFSKAVDEGAYKISKGDKYVIIDVQDGMGAVPDTKENISRGMALTVIMTPSTFLSLALDDEGSQEKTADWMIERIKENYSLGSLFLRLNLEVDKEDALYVTTHEGRGRAKAIRKYLGDVDIPVQILNNTGIKLKNVSQENMQKIEDGFILPEEWAKFKGLKGDKNAKMFVIGKHSIKDIIK